MKKKIFEMMTFICMFFSFIICFFGVEWCERTGRIDILAVGVLVMLAALMFDKLKGKRDGKREDEKGA